MADAGNKANAQVQRGRGHSAFGLMGEVDRGLILNTQGWLRHRPRFTGHISDRIAAELERW